MSYILFNADGSLNTQNFDYYINQGSTGVDTIFVYVADTDPDVDVCSAFFTLPNGQTNLVQGVPDTQTISGTSYSGWKITLTTDQTTYNGLLRMAISVVVSGSQLLVSYPVALVVNETGWMPDADTGVTIEEINSYLVYLQSLTADIADVYTKAESDAKFLAKRTNALTINTSYAYVVTNNNGSYVQGVMQIDGTNATAYTIPTRRANGELVVGSPTANAHAVNLQYANSHYIDFESQQTISGKKIFNDFNLYNAYITSNSKNYFVRVGVTSGQYVTYKLPYSYSDVGAQTYTLATESYVDDAIASLGDVFNYRGSFTVSYINTNLTSNVLVKGDVVNVTDSGTLTLGNVVVTAGDNVVWNGTAWDRLAGDFVPSGRTIAGISLVNDISAQTLTDALIFASTSDIDAIMED